MGNYATYDDVKKEGSTAPEARVNARIAKWEAIVEQLLGQVFYLVSPGELIFDGNNSRILHFNLPLVSVTSLKVNGETTALDAENYRAYTGYQPPQDDRRNPKIILHPQRASIYTPARQMFVKGLNQAITATWGYLDDDGAGGRQTPIPIKEAIIQLVMLDLDDYFTQASEGSGISGGEAGGGELRVERTDGHEIQYQETAPRQKVWAMIPSHIAEVLMIYRRPFRVAAPELIRFSSDPSATVYVEAN